MKIVADTNVLISALFWKGKLQQLTRLINNRRILLCFSPDTIDELYDVAAYNHILSKAQQYGINPIEIIDQIVMESLIIYPARIIPVITADPSDNMFLACALSAQADFIISGDKHLLNLKEYNDIPIVSSATFIRTILQ